VRAGDISLDPDGARGLVTLSGDRDPRSYLPVDLPPLRDPGLPDMPEEIIRADVEAWIRDTLAPALARTCSDFPALRLAVEVRFTAAVDVFTLEVARGATRVTRELDDDWDALNVVAGSLLWEVLHARKNWGDLLLSGALRACTRAYDVRDGRLQPLPLGEIFLYHGLSYDDAVRRAVEREVESHRPRT
jgi:hypothetical protein